jgi:chemotaxis response regulator CheB
MACRRAWDRPGVRGGHIIAQDERSSIVFGMNGKAIENGLVDEVLPLEIIGERLNQMVDFQNR